MLDPTHEEMTEFLVGTQPEADQFDRECAIYWFAADYHSGQGSNLYSALSTSEYKPGALERGPDDCLALECYASLEAFFGRQP